jgi:hypothetical protein
VLNGSGHEAGQASDTAAAPSEPAKSETASAQAVQPADTKTGA